MVREDVEARSAFLHTLEWLLAVMERYDSPLQFGLVHIAYGNKNELGEAYGAQEAVKQLAAVTQSLKQAFRKTDMVARNGTDFWIIVPYTPANEKLHDKILGIIEAGKHHGLNIVDREVSIFSLPLNLADDQKPATALDLLDYLKNNKATLASQVFRLSAEQ